MNLDIDQLIIAACTAISTGAVTYGAIKNRVANSEKRIENFEARMEEVEDDIHKAREFFITKLESYVTVVRFEAAMNKFDTIEADIKRLIEMVASIKKERE